MAHVMLNHQPLGTAGVWLTPHNQGTVAAQMVLRVDGVAWFELACPLYADLMLLRIGPAPNARLLTAHAP